MTWSSDAFRRIAERVRRRTGLVFPADRRPEVEASIRRQMARLGIGDTARYLARIESDGVARDALVAELTVGESYFFRDPDQFRIIRDRIVPELAAADGERPLRCWSAGCSAGEEPYSLAILLEELGVGDAFILGTDIARPRLLQAQRGDYSRWSLRGLPEPTVIRYFRRVGNRFHLVPRIRERVRFGYLNLAEDRYPSLGSDVWSMDLILCRNVLIYFDAPTVAEVLHRLVETLTPEGWLLLGASDPVVSDTTRCEAVLTPAGLAYRRRVDGAVVPAPSPPAARTPPPPAASAPDRPRPPARPIEPRVRIRPEEREPAASPPATGDLPIEDVRRLYGEGRYTEAATAAARALAEGGSEPELWTIRARALANVGELEEAGRVTARGLEEVGPTAGLLYIESVLLAHANQPEEAAAAARRALYLEPGMIVAHLAYADALDRLGRHGTARRALRNASELLAELDSDQPVPDADGEAAGRLGELVRVRRRLLDEVGQ